MSNYLSTPIRYSPPPTDANFELLSKVALMQQQKYDVNHQQIQQTLDAFGAMKTLRPEDDQYIAAKLNSITTQINSAGGNLANQSLSDSLMSKIKGAAQDPFILNAFEQTAKMKTYQAEVAKIKEKKPELYNDLNNAYALDQAGYTDYMAGKSDKMGTLSYSTYTDYKKEFKDFSENLDKYANVEKSSSPDGTGYIYTKEGKYLTKDEIEGMVGTLLSDGAKKQMQIDGWGTYDKGATDADKLKNVTTAFTAFKTNALADVDAKMKIAEGNLKNNPNDPSLQQTVDGFKKYKEQLGSSYDSMISSGNKAGMYTEMYTKQTVGTFAGAFAFNHVGITVGEDANYTKMRDLEYKAAQEKAKVAKETALAVQTRTDEAYSAPEQKGDLYTQQVTHIDALEKELDGVTNRVYEGLDAKTKGAIDEKVKQSNGNLTKAEVLLDFGLTSSRTIAAADAEKIDMLRQQVTAEKTRFSKYTKQAAEESNAILAQSSDKIAAKLFETPGIKMMWAGKDGRQRMYSAKDVLLGTGVVDANGNVKKNIKDVRGLQEAMQKSILADKTLSNYVGDGTFSDTSDTYSRAKALGALHGENENNIFKLVSEDPIMGGKEYELNPNSKTAQFIAQHQKGGGFNKYGAAGVFMPDNSFDDISEVDDYLKKASSGSLQNRIGELLYNDRNSVMGIGKVTAITPGTVPFKELAAVSGKFNIGGSYGMEIRPIPNQPNMVRVSQNQAPTAKDPNPAPITVEMKISDLPQSLQSRVDLENKKAAFTAESMPETPTHVIYNDHTDRSRLYDIGTTFLGGDKAKADTTTITGATNSLFTSFPQKLGTVEKPTEMGNLVKTMLNDKNLYVTVDKQKLSSGTVVVPKVMRRVGNQETTIFTGDPYTGRVTDDNAEAAYKAIRFTPQIYVNVAIKNIIQGMDTGTAITLEELKKIYGI